MNNVRNRASDGYFSWLCNKVGVFYGGPHETAVKLMWQLHSIDFEYSIVNDINRIKDGLMLRERYMEEAKVDGDWSWPCSVFEVLIGLARRFSEEVLGDDSPGEELLNKWFWQMIKNLGLMKFARGNYDKGECCIIISRWISRRFEADGSGSPFPLRHPEEDQRKVEIWQQICSYLAENPELEE